MARADGAVATDGLDRVLTPVVVSAFAMGPI